METDARLIEENQLLTITLKTKAMKNHEAKVEQLFEYLSKNDNPALSPSERQKDLEGWVKQFNEDECGIDEDFDCEQMANEYLNQTK